MSGLILLVFAVNFIGWSWLHEDILADPVGSTAIKYYCAQTLLVVSLIAFGVIGYSKAIVIEWASGSLVLSRGKEEPVRVGTDEIEHFEIVSADDYHRYQARYAGVIPFINAVPKTILLIRTSKSILALGLCEADSSDLFTRLDGSPARNAPNERLRVA
jgi:hypothetical protein